MTAEGLFSRLRRKPFTPFRVHLSGGNFYDIRHPELMLVSKNGVTVALHDPGQAPDDVPARDVLISFLHITSVEDLPTSQPSAA